MSLMPSLSSFPDDDVFWVHVEAVTRLDGIVGECKSGDGARFSDGQKKPIDEHGFYGVGQATEMQAVILRRVWRN